MKITDTVTGQVNEYSDGEFVFGKYRKVVRFMLSMDSKGKRTVTAMCASMDKVKVFPFNLKAAGLEMGDAVAYEDLTDSAQKRAVRLWFEEIQEGRCAHCGEPLSGNPHEKVLEWKFQANLFPSGFLKYPVHLHHDHIGGGIIGAVHALCNAHSWGEFGK